MAAIFCSDLFRVTHTRVVAQQGVRPNWQRIGFTGHRVLVVDDDRVTLKLLEEILVDVGYEVKTAIRAFEAMELFIKDEREFDVVISTCKISSSFAIWHR
jgi:PleD family two-component response regulator